MTVLQRAWSATTVPESSVALVGLLIAAVGLVLPVPALVGLGASLLVAGTAYVAAAGSEPVRLAVAFVSLVAVQLLAFAGPTRWIGALAVGCVAVVVAYGRTGRGH